MAYIEFKDVKKEYITGAVKIPALEGCSFGVEKGELAVILGPSGAGKTTVLNLLGGMDRPSGGEITVDGREVSAFGKKDLILYRRRDIGFVFQFYNLISSLTALENVELACQISASPLDAGRILEQVGLAERTRNFPAQLSGGEQQRVAIARAMAKNPRLLLCDEPTGALDSVTGQKILSLLQSSCREQGMTTVLITHNSAIAEIADRVISVKNGAVVSEHINETPARAEDISW